MLARVIPLLILEIAILLLLASRFLRLFDIQSRVDHGLPIDDLVKEGPDDAFWVWLVGSFFLSWFLTIPVYLIFSSPDEVLMVAFSAGWLCLFVVGLLLFIRPRSEQTGAIFATSR